MTLIGGRFVQYIVIIVDVHVCVYVWICTVHVHQGLLQFAAEGVVVH